MQNDPMTRPERKSMTPRAVAAFLMVVAGSAGAQNPPRTVLSKPDASFPEPFSNVAGLRELSDGRVMLSDRLEQAVSILSLASGDITPVGRQGQGPGEYTMPGALFAWPGDSSLLFDLGGFRGLAIAPTGAVGRTITLQSPGGLPIMPQGVDQQGRIYARPPALFQGSDSRPDSVAIVRFATGGPTDTIAWMKTVGAGGSVVAFQSTGGGGAPSVRMTPYAPEDGWAVAPDGRIALVRAGEYRVEWIAPDGRRTVGPRLSYTPIKIGKAEKEEWADQMGGAVMMMRTPQGSRTMRPPRPNIDEQTWPDAKPPFVANGIRVSPEGELWIPVSQPAGTKTALYDIVDARGQRVRQVVLPEGRRLVGLGKGTLYAVRRDADDLEWLERYRR
jgi:hypothetical protein